MLKRAQRLTLLLLSLTLPTVLFATEVVAGKDYEEISVTNLPEISPPPGEHGVSVMEFFSFGCSWCYRLEPSLTHWVREKGNRISFTRVPVVFHKQWDYYARAYYIADALSVGPTLVPALFKAIMGEKKTLSSDQAMIDFFVAQNVDAELVQSAFEHSPGIEMRVNAGRELMGRYRITSIPTLIVNHRFKTNLEMTKTESHLFEVLDFLIKKSKADSDNS